MEVVEITPTKILCDQFVDIRGERHSPQHLAIVT